MLNIWTEKSGFSFGIIQERTIINQALPVTYQNDFDDSTNLNFQIITGSLPPGLRINQDRIVGTAFEVPRDTEYRFVIRASYNGQIADRTFFITVSGADTPDWRTPAGSLPVGPNDAYYILDSSYIDFQLSVVDSDTATGQQLQYFIPSGGGELPPGLILTDSGRIVGWVQPVLAPPLVDGNGAFDTGLYDKVAFDYGVRPSNGYDSYVFDSINFDFSTPSNPPRKLNRNYEFNVIVTDGDSYSSRKFRIYVVGDDFFRVDNTITQSGTGTFTADITYARAPQWTTPADLGVYRANNYKTFRLDVYDDEADFGLVLYNLEAVNPDISGIAYTTSTTENRVGSNKLRLKSVIGTPLVNHKIQFKEYVSGADDTVFTITEVIAISSTEYLLTVGGSLTKSILNDTLLYLGTASITPPGMQFDPSTAEIFGVLPYQTAITKIYRFTVNAIRNVGTDETASSKRTFTATILGEVDSTITWLTNADLGSIGANYISTLKVTAVTTVTDSPMLYSLKAGYLPNGLALNIDGEIVGKSVQFGTLDQLGLTRFFDQSPQIATKTFTTFDDGDTTIDRQYSFTVEARDIYGFSAITRTFILRIDTPNDRLYSNLTVRPFLKQDQRTTVKSFINDPSIFDIDAIYRPTDANFGIQKDLKMLVYSGIETKTAAQVVGVIGRNHKPKRFKLGDVKKAKANDPGTTNTVYEVLYLEVFDPLEINDKYLPNIIRTVGSQRNITVDQNNEFYQGPGFDQINPYWDRPIPLDATIDRNDIFVGDPDTEFKFPASISIWRKRIESLGIKERNYMPLWMRTIQDGTVQELGYVKAIPLCYCKPGRADDILLNIRNYLKNNTNFSFNKIDYVIDRYIIDSVTGYNEDKYIVFRNDRTTIT